MIDTIKTNDAAIPVSSIEFISTDLRQAQYLIDVHMQSGKVYSQSFGSKARNRDAVFVDYSTRLEAYQKSQ